MSERTHSSFSFEQSAARDVVRGQAVTRYRVRHTSGEVLVGDLQSVHRMLVGLPGARVFVVVD